MNDFFKLTFSYRSPCFNLGFGWQSFASVPMRSLHCVTRFKMEGQTGLEKYSFTRELNLY